MGTVKTPRFHTWARRDTEKVYHAMPSRSGDGLALCGAEIPNRCLSGGTYRCKKCSALLPAEEARIWVAMARETLSSAIDVASDERRRHRRERADSARYIEEARAVLRKARAKLAVATHEQPPTTGRGPCGMCEGYRWLTDDGKPAKGQSFKFSVHSCPRCNPSGKLHSSHKWGVKPYVRGKKT